MKIEFKDLNWWRGYLLKQCVASRRGFLGGAALVTARETLVLIRRYKAEVREAVK